MSFDSLLPVPSKANQLALERSFAFMFSTKIANLVLLTLLSCGLANAQSVVWFEEDFNDNTANWKNENSTSGADLTHITTGGIDNSGFGTIDFPFSSASPFGATIFRAQDEFNSSNLEYTGDWLAANIVEVKVNVRHNLPVANTFSIRAALASNQPGTGPALGSGQLVQPNTWTELSFLVEDFVAQAAPGDTEIVLSNVGHFQVTADVPFAPGAPEFFASFTYDIDSVSLIAEVPEPTSAAMACLMAVACTFVCNRR